MPMTMKNRIFRTAGIISILLIASIVFSSCSKTDDDKLVVGMELAYPPFETTDKDNKPTGISVDLAYSLGEALGREVVIENIAWTGLIPALETDKIDIIISSMTINDERKKTIDFSDPYASIGLALLIGNDSSVQTFEDLKEQGKILAVKKGTSGHIYAQEHLPEENIMVLDKESACVLEVIQGKADAFTYDQLTIYRQWMQNEDTTRVNLEPYQEAADFWGIGVNKDNPELTEEINAFISDFREDGGFNSLAEKYLKDEKDKFAELDIPFFFDIR
jgi:polar amino acid transport system substrate-binding protein